MKKRGKNQVFVFIVMDRSIFFVKEFLNESRIVNLRDSGNPSF